MLGLYIDTFITGHTFCMMLSMLNDLKLQRFCKYLLQIMKFEQKVKNATTKQTRRAQRALGRSPEEKVKGHSGANNREPQGHNLNNFGRGPFDDVIY